MLQLCVRQVCLALLFFPYASLSAHELPDPDGKPGDVTKPVQVFILLGQSNMLGAGKVEGGKKPEGSLRNAVKIGRAHV